jgi:hypothetical protein
MAATYSPSVMRVPPEADKGDLYARGASECEEYIYFKLGD